MDRTFTAVVASVREERSASVGHQPELISTVIAAGTVLGQTVPAASRYPPQPSLTVSAWRVLPEPIISL